MPATRHGRIDFCKELRENELAFITAKCITIKSESRLPQVVHHANQVDIGSDRRWANITAYISGKWNIGGPYTPGKNQNIDLSTREAEIATLSYMGRGGNQRWKNMFSIMKGIHNDSFGMAKAFVRLPKHQVKDIDELLQKIHQNPIKLHKPKSDHKIQNYQMLTPMRSNSVDQELVRISRLKSFRAIQSELPLPIDLVEKDIPFEAAVTILEGGTGSGKTTRYPLMLSLLDHGIHSPKVLVAQPRRLACQTAAQFVASEQGFQMGSKDCPVGYTIRFESFLPKGNRTVQFVTPGVLLRRAMNDPLMKDVTHFVIDEVHTRDADMDLLLAFAKQVIRRRENHETLPPLKVVLMSATLDSSIWESYFHEIVEKNKIKILKVPDKRRFPIETIYIGDRDFPKLNSLRALKNCHDLEYDEVLCEVIAELAWEQVKLRHANDGSILCFLPGMDEIRRVHRRLSSLSNGKKQFTVCYLHSSLSSQEQAKAFVPGLKVILSTNIAETSVTIPDVKIVIDSGRERQHSLLDSVSNSQMTTVVGSQLATVNISESAAIQRKGRAGRVSAGVCFRLYTQKHLKTVFEPYAVPEMLRIDLSQLVLHSLSFCHQALESPLELLRGAPDAPSEVQLKRVLQGLILQGIVTSDQNQKKIDLTPLGEAVSGIPLSPRLGRMLMLGLALRAIEPALTIASLLSVPRVFSSVNRYDDEGGAFCSSDILRLLRDYKDFSQLDKKGQTKIANRSRDKLFHQVSRVKRQLEGHMKSFVGRRMQNDKGDMKWKEWNANSDRVGAIVGLICCATPNIAHLVTGKSGFSTRDVAGKAQIHPSSVNFNNSKRAHWYMYNQLRETKHPYLHVTTAVSPLEVALFTEMSGIKVTGNNKEKIDNEEYYQNSLTELNEENRDWLYIADQWVPVDTANVSQRGLLLRLRNSLMHDMLQQAAQDPKALLSKQEYRQLVLFVLAALEQQRLER